MGDLMIRNNQILMAEVVDTATGALEVIDYAHHEVHSGSHYFIEGFTTLGEAETLYVKLVTPDTGKWAHLTWEISSNGILEAYLYEGVSGGMAGGSGVTPINNNRNSTKTSGLTVTNGVAVASDLGTTISQTKMGGTGFKTNIGGSTIRTNEIILKQNTTYLRKFLSGSADNIVSFRASWYEHQNKV